MKARTSTDKDKLKAQQKKLEKRGYETRLIQSGTVSRGRGKKRKPQWVLYARKPKAKKGK